VSEDRGPGEVRVADGDRLALSCGLHQIPSSVFKPDPLADEGRADLITLMRTTTYMIPPPRDAIELGERIWAL
jgi:hypothetical protein